MLGGMMASGQSAIGSGLASGGAFNNGMGDPRGIGMLKSFGNSPGTFSGGGIGEQHGILSAAMGRGGGGGGKRREMAESLSSLSDPSGAGAGLAQYKDVSTYGAKPYDMNSMMSELNQLAGMKQQMQQQEQPAQPLVNMQDPRVQQILGMILGG
jgi:hypothetical protein